MHISEGVLSGPLLISGFIFAFTGAAIGLKKMDLDRVAEIGILSSACFIASLIHIPIGFSNVHLTLSGLVGLLLGWISFPTIITALIIQAIILQYGGITTLGINTLVMAIPAVLSHYIYIFFVVKKNINIALVAFVCGVFSVLLGGILLSSCLLLADSSFREVTILIMAAHIPIMIIEGIVTSTCVSFLNKVRPELLPSFSLKKKYKNNY